eukprot:CAMPEP_0205903526 /NCGR_PEP_ID=MMETSP1325-20131115/151_1 /ASSEMBLY_ACC=CAM_ASM_000708 /TAXON_ID=236786 /ORGANISM="Florenciella sp., Strain RCC1007" /LENGTH=420 /DNA_ID=CAMNT_0053269185 /DNA_START=54 /DNA_END=1315 /DNA_ORIENTATION=+
MAASSNKRSAVQDAILERERKAQLRYRGRPHVGHDELDEIAVLDGHANEIIPGLYLGSFRACDADMGAQLAQIGVTGIINCTTDAEAACHHPRRNTDCTKAAVTHGTTEDGCPFQAEYVRISIHDTEAASLLPYLKGATAFIRRHLEPDSSSGRDRGAVLVHCQRGVSRSASVVIAYLITEGMTRDEAYTLVKRRRRLVDPNIGFFEQLLTFERGQKGGGEVDSRSSTDAAATAGVEEDTLAGAPDMAYDETWCRQSVASFSMGAHDEAFAGITQSTACDALSSSLDLVLSRGIRDSDLQWLGAMVRRVTDLGDKRGSVLVQEIMGWSASDRQVTGQFEERWGVDFPKREFARLVVALEEAEGGGGGLIGQNGKELKRPLQDMTTMLQAGTTAQAATVGLLVSGICLLCIQASQVPQRRH